MQRKHSHMQQLIDLAIAKSQAEMKKYIDRKLNERCSDLEEAVDLADTILSKEKDRAVFDEWLPSETANNNESELSAEEQLLKEGTEEHKNQIDLGTVDCTPKPTEKAYSASVVEELIAKLEVAEAACARLKKRADLAECKFWDADSKQSGDSYVSEAFLKQCNELRAENKKMEEQLEIANRKNEKLVQLLQATPVTGNADRTVTTQSKKTDIIELTVQDILKKHQPKPAEYGYILFGEDNFKTRVFDTQLLPIISALYDEVENMYGECVL